MSQLIIKGGQPLAGTIKVKGSKNAALPLIAASLLTNQEVHLKNVPYTRDIVNLLEIMRSMNVSITTQQSSCRIRANHLNISQMRTDLVGKLRGSIMLVGGLLRRSQTVSLPEPGGDVIGARPIDVHLDALQQLGAKITHHHHKVRLDGRSMRAGQVVLKEFSVTATENLLIVAASLPGQTTIHIAASEPHIVNLAQLLKQMGADIQGAGTPTITIKGKRHLGSANLSLIPDMLEAGFFILLAAATKSTVTVTDVPVGSLRLFFKKLDEIGVAYEINGVKVSVKPAPLHGFHLQTMPYPGLATDLQAPFSVIATQAQGTTLIHDPLYESRFKHCDELIKMGANVTICDPHRVIVEGPTKLFGSHVKSLDIRSGATLIMAGAVATGKTYIDEAEIIARGYVDLPARLRQIGVDIKQVP